MSYDVQILDMWHFLFESRKFVEVGGKETKGVNL